MKLQCVAMLVTAALAATTGVQVRDDGSLWLKNQQVATAEQALDMSKRADSLILTANGNTYKLVKRQDYDDGTNTWVPDEDINDNENYSDADNYASTATDDDYDEDDELYYSTSTRPQYYSNGDFADEYPGYLDGSNDRYADDRCYNGRYPGRYSSPRYSNDAYYPDEQPSYRYTGPRAYGTPTTTGLNATESANARRARRARLQEIERQSGNRDRDRDLIRNRRLRRQRGGTNTAPSDYYNYGDGSSSDGYYNYDGYYDNIDGYAGNGDTSGYNTNIGGGSDCGCNRGTTGSSCCGSYGGDGSTCASGCCGGARGRRGPLGTFWGLLRPSVWCEALDNASSRSKSCGSPKPPCGSPKIPSCGPPSIPSYSPQPLPVRPSCRPSSRPSSRPSACAPQPSPNCGSGGFCGLGSLCPSKLSGGYCGSLGSGSGSCGSCGSLGSLGSLGSCGSCGSCGSSSGCGNCGSDSCGGCLGGTRSPGSDGTTYHYHYYGSDVPIGSNYNDPRVVPSAEETDRPRIEPGYGPSASQLAQDVAEYNRIIREERARLASAASLSAVAAAQSAAARTTSPEIATITRTHRVTLPAPTASATF